MRATPPVTAAAGIAAALGLAPLGLAHRGAP
jgi:hypothetical protein